jgi:hypothetical protein
MPSALDVPVVAGEARSAPCSIGTPSKPICAGAVDDAVVLSVVVEDADGLLLEDEDEGELLLPHPASARPAVTIEIRAERLIAEGRER